MESVLGTILDPAADKALMTTLTITLAMKGLLPGTCLVIVFCHSHLICRPDGFSFFGCCDHRERCSVESFSVLHSVYLTTRTCTLFTARRWLHVISSLENVLSLLGFLHTFSRSPTNNDQQGHLWSQKCLGLPLIKPHRSILLFNLSSWAPPLSTQFFLSSWVLLFPHYSGYCCVSPNNSSQFLARWIVATTTIWSGLSYIFSKDAVRIVSQRRRRIPPSES